MCIPKVLLVGAALCLFGVSARAADIPSIEDGENSVLTAVFSKTDKSYRRKKGPDGKWIREYYAMTNAGAADGTMQDNAQGRIKFVAIATVLAEHLAMQGYFPATEKDQVDLLLVVNWGKTMPFTDNLYREGVQNTLSSMNALVQKMRPPRQRGPTRGPGRRWLRARNRATGNKWTSRRLPATWRRRCSLRIC